MKVLIIDPWCVNGTSLYSYTTGMVSCISRSEEVTMVVPYDFTIPEGDEYEVKKWFFPNSSKMASGLPRKIVRGLEYAVAYSRIIQLCKTEKFDIVQIEWPLLYSLDAKCFSIIKNYCGKLILKAHNVLPHSTGLKYKEIMRKLYDIADIVLIHGEGIKREFSLLYPEFIGKLVIQHHGMFMNHNKTYDKNRIDRSIRETIEQYDRIYLCYGSLHHDKGIDRLVKIWLERFKERNALLIIAGSVDKSYESLWNYYDQMRETKNILFLPGHIDDNTLNYLLSSCSIVVLPYRKGSMSGVVFTCAEFEKTVITTRFGAIDDYLSIGKNAFVVDNTDDNLSDELMHIEKEIDNQRLAEMGHSLALDFEANYSWDNIVSRLIQDAYY